MRPSTVVVVVVGGGGDGRRATAGVESENAERSGIDPIRGAFGGSAAKKTGTWSASTETNATWR
jgi:succinate dehydrogenase/fumarate reductase flavoprotein subunit